jgi:hypothetical protein
MPRQANGAQNHSGQADEVSIAEAACNTDCFPDLDAATYSRKNWLLSAPCSTCHREVPRKAWRALSSQMDWAEL